MHTISFECEIITPMFLAGADGASPELRAPSIKGALRFWWRALNGDKDIKELRKQEAEIFGGTDEKVGRSKVIIQSSHYKIEPLNEKPLPHHTGDRNCPACNNDNVCKKGYNNESIPISYKFDIKLSLSQEILLSNSQKFDLDELESIFILACLLGGLGRRSRRGFGSVKIIKKNSFLFSMPESINDIIPHIAKFNPNYQIDPISSLSKIILIKSAFLERQYPYIEEIEIGNQDYSSFNNIVKRIGQSSHHFVHSSNGSGTPRFSSPTYVSVLKKKDKDEYFPIITTLHFAPPNDNSDNISNKQKFKNTIFDKSVSLS